MTTEKEPPGKEELQVLLKIFGCLALILLVGLVLFGLMITGVFWIIFALVFQLIAVSWPLWVFFLVIRIVVENGQLPVVVGLRWWAVSATFVHAFLILGLFDEALRRTGWGPGPPSHLSAWRQLLLGALLALPIGAVAFYAQRGYCRCRLKRSS
ncbi:MAG: hypothetical protein ACRYFR_10345 [Janthinobacterium lividum]